MAAAFLTGRHDGRRAGLEVVSAGLLPGGMASPPEVVEAMDALRFDLRAHRSRQMTGGMLGPADLVVGMGRRHVQEAVLLDGACWPRSFTLKELVRRGEAVGPRPDGATLASWVEVLHAGRTAPSSPTGPPPTRSPTRSVDRPRATGQTAAELSSLVDRLAALLRPDAPSGPPPPVPVPELEVPPTGRA